MFIFQQHITRDDACERPDYIFVFGDNLLRRGKAGQAQIRGIFGAYGVATKRLPAMTNQSFFSDKQDEYDTVLEELTSLWQMHKDGKTIVLPVNPPGSGLAKLQSKSPIIWKLIVRFYNAAKGTQK